MNKSFIQYNAHRVYTFDMIKSYFKGCTLHQFSRLNLQNKPISNASDYRRKSFFRRAFLVHKKLKILLKTVFK